MLAVTKKSTRLVLWLAMFIYFIAITLFAQERFPRPEFESNYQQPFTTTPPARTGFYEYLDLLVLILALALSSYFSLKKRSRRALFVLMVFSLLYFGFWRKGCVCPIGAIQNVATALFESTYVLPFTVFAFFALPLIVALFLGRSFCGAVCPLGAIQDLFLLQPTRVTPWLARVLGLLPYIYLGLAVLFAATGSAFIICRFDPFVAFFRLSGNFNMIIFGICLLTLSVVIARPYCRFLCPYGVLLGWMSRLAGQRVTITPNLCVQCRLCEDACPVGAIRQPAPYKAPETREQGIRRLAILLLLLPLVIIASGWSIARMDDILARVHPTVRLAEQVTMEDLGLVKETTVASRTFRATGTPVAELFSQAENTRAQFYTGGWFLGGFLGLVFMVKLISLSIWRVRNDYQPDPGACVSCGRCFLYCPKEHVRLKNNVKH